MKLLSSTPGFQATPRRGAATAGLALVAAALAMVACVGVAAADSNPQFEQNCVMCHGADARGVEGLGVDLVDSAFVAKSSAAELVAFLKQGRMPDDPASRTQRPMPGFSWIAETDLQAIASYLKNTVSKKQGG